MVLVTSCDKSKLIHRPPIPRNSVLGIVMGPIGLCATANYSEGVASTLFRHTFINITQLAY
jgi:hypothetical protein